MYLNRLAQVVSVITVALFVSAAALPAFAGNCGNGVGSGNASCKNGTASGSVAPMPTLGTGAPALLILVGGLLLLSHRRRR